jgi:hypothetical protein
LEFAQLAQHPCLARHIEVLATREKASQPVSEELHPIYPVFMCLGESNYEYLRSCTAIRRGD